MFFWEMDSIKRERGHLIRHFKGFSATIILAVFNYFGSCLQSGLKRSKCPLLNFFFHSKRLRPNGNFELTEILYSLQPDITNLNVEFEYEVDPLKRFELAVNNGFKRAENFFTR